MRTTANPGSSHHGCQLRFHRGTGRACQSLSAGSIALVDFDVVDFSNLQRQILHGTPDVGRPKLLSARDRLQAINPEVRLDLYETRLTSANALSIFAPYDIVIDGTDNFPTRYLVNDACVLLRKPNVYGSIFRFDGQASAFAPPAGPCYRCPYPQPPPPGEVPVCGDRPTNKQLIDYEPFCGVRGQEAPAPAAAAGAAEITVEELKGRLDRG